MKLTDIISAIYKIRLVAACVVWVIISMAAFAGPKKKPAAQPKGEPPMCSLTDREHICHCPSMVMRAQDQAIAECQKKATWEEERACLAQAVPSHCEVIGTTQLWGTEAEGKDQKNRCKTSCHPERCRCHDTGCAPHGGQ